MEDEDDPFNASQIIKEDKPKATPKGWGKGHGRGRVELEVSGWS